MTRGDVLASVHCSACGKFLVKHEGNPQMFIKLAFAHLRAHEAQCVKAQRRKARP